MKKHLGWCVLWSIVLCAAAAYAGPSVVINEVAWGGTAAGSQDEWLELRNCTAAPIDLTGWVLEIGEARVPLSVVLDGTVEVRRASIEANGYLLLERTDDTTVSDVTADLLYKGAISNTGVPLRLLDAAGRVVDEVVPGEEGWPAGTADSATASYATMERVDPDELGGAWRTNDGVVRNGLDAAGNPLLGTPRATNSATVDYLTAPRVQLHAIATEVSGCPLSVQWEAIDPDGLAAGLLVTVLVREVGTEEWTVVVERLPNQGSFAWDCSAYEKGRTYELRVTTADWEGRSGSATSAPFTLR